MKEYQGWNEWFPKHKPIKNHFSSDPNCLMFETYGEEVEFVRNYKPENIWTYVSGDGCDLIIAGYHYVNRIGYYITEVPWETDNDSVLISVEEECECYSEDDDVLEERNDNWGDPECGKCEGSGYVTKWID